MRIFVVQILYMIATSTAKIVLQFKFKTKWQTRVAAGGGCRLFHHLSVCQTGCGANLV